MRKLLQSIVAWILKLEARAVLRKYKPRIIAVTGSVGKTTTKELIAAMVRERFQLRASPGGYNTEFGVPLTILDQPVGRGARQWLRVLWHGLQLAWGRQDYPEVLILEMGADHPGDLRYLTHLAPLDIAVVTNVGTAHLQNYPSSEAIAEEKSWLVRNLKPDGQAVLNFDDKQVRLMQAHANGRAVYFGTSDEAMVWPSDIKLGQGGLSATINLKDAGEVKSWPVTTQLLSEAQLQSVLAAFAVAYLVGVDPKQALAAASQFTSPAGRLRLFDGKNGLTIIDDSYNSSPLAALNSLKVLKGFPGPHRAILGDMRELGEGSAAGHRQVGEAAAEFLDELVVVGDEAAQIAYAAREQGMSEANIHLTHQAAEAVALVNQNQRGGTLLVKGSQNVYLERAVEALLANPHDRSRLLQRLKDPAHQKNLRAQTKGGAAKIR